ncbi:MAG: 2,3-bisphosphoglycerate-independent phosphoglycerate mutase [Acidobacteriota bacterium]
MKKRPVCLIIRDGWGKGKEKKSNAIFSANTPHTDRYEKEYPTMLINTSGTSVGLPEGYQGNSEVGHLNIGAGRTVYQSLTRIDREISTGEFFRNKEILDAINHAENMGSAIHLMGLVQEEGVHAVTRHLIALLKMVGNSKVKDIFIHAITDGRDTPPRSAMEHMDFLQKGIDSTGVGRIATVTGRYYAMDRDKRWDRTEKAYRAVLEGKGEKADDWKSAILDAYEKNQGDEFIEPRVINYSGVEKNDVFIFFNFRFDRTRQLTQAIVEKDFDNFKTGDHSVYFLAMTHYYDDGNFKEAYPELSYKNILGEIISEKGIKQLRISETEKYAHVTFFFNALKNDPFKDEERILIKSPDVATYDLKPEMSAFEVRDRLVDSIREDKYGFIVCNFANCDMVGHTGIYEKIVTAVETVDKCTSDVINEILNVGGVVILTADHGNAEETELEDGTPMTSHTINPVPLTLIGLNGRLLREAGNLSDIAPTILEIMGIVKPDEMDGNSLLV